MLATISTPPTNLALPLSTFVGREQELVHLSRVFGTTSVRLLTLEDAIYKMTGMAAERMKLKQRGLVRKGFAADLCIFNPETIGCAADAHTPNREPQGIEHVLVNGNAVLSGGKWCGDNVLAGEWLTRA